MKKRHVEAIALSGALLATGVGISTVVGMKHRAHKWITTSGGAIRDTFTSSDAPALPYSELGYPVLTI